VNVLLVPAHPGFPGQIPQSRKTVVCVFAARKPTCTILYRLLGCTGKNKVKMAVSVAMEGKLEVEICR